MWWRNKYYKNGSKKIEGNFLNINSYNGIYYNPYNDIIFNGEINHEIPFKLNQLNLYNDNGYLIFYSNIYEDKNIQNEQNYSSKNKDKKYKLNKNILLSTGPPGKTSIMRLLCEKIFPSNLLTTVGIDFQILIYEFQNDLYKLQIWDTSGNKKNITIFKSYIKTSDIIIIVFDLSEKDNIDESWFEIIKKYSDCERHLIYLVGNKLDKSNKYYLENYRKRAKILIDTGKIDKYFETSVKTKEGFEQFLKILKIDNAIFYQTKRNKSEYYDFIRNEALKDFHISKFNQLNEYLDY